MAKPTTIPEWCTDEVNMTAPSAGQKTTGWTDGQDGVSDYDNWFKNATYKWIVWLNAGLLEDVTLEDVIVTGSTTYTDATDYALTMNIDSAQLSLLNGPSANTRTLYVTPDTDGWTLSGILDGTDGREIDIVNASSTNYFLIEHTDPATSGLFVLPVVYVQEQSKLMIPPGGSVRVRYKGTTTAWHVISTTGCMKYERFRIPASAAMPVFDSTGGNLALIFQGDSVATDTDPATPPSIYYPITLPTYSLLDNWRFYVSHDPAGSTIVGSISRTLGTTGVSAAVGTGGSSTSTTLASFVDATASISHRVSGAYQYYFVAGFSGGNGADELLHLDVFAWIPI